MPQGVPNLQRSGSPSHCSADRYQLLVAPTVLVKLFPVETVVFGEAAGGRDLIGDRLQRQARDLRDHDGHGGDPGAHLPPRLGREVANTAEREGMMRLKAARGQTSYRGSVPSATTG